LSDDRDLIVYNGEPHLFLRHVSREKIAQWKTTTRKSNNDTVSKLLREFFSYYSTFSFASDAITLNNGKLVSNPTREPMYIVNPLDITHNVSRNVSTVFLDIFFIFTGKLILHGTLLKKVWSLTKLNSSR